MDLQRRKSSLMWLMIAFCKDVTALVDQGSEVDIVYHAFRKGFSTDSYNIFTDELMKYR